MGRKYKQTDLGLMALLESSIVDKTAVQDIEREFSI
jgi:hypothetical protein